MLPRLRRVAYLQVFNYCSCEIFLKAFVPPDCQWLSTAFPCLNPPLEMEMPRATSLQHKACVPLEGCRVVLQHEERLEKGNTTRDLVGEGGGAEGE